MGAVFHVVLETIGGDQFGKVDEFSFWNVFVVLFVFLLMFEWVVGG